MLPDLKVIVYKCTIVSEYLRIYCYVLLHQLEHKCAWVVRSVHEILLGGATGIFIHH